MSYKSSEIKAGIMIVISILVLLLFLVAIFGIKVGEESKYYWVYLENVGGIKKGSLVKYRGMDVGQVSEIQFPTPEHPQMGLQIKISQETPVRQDSRAYITSVSLMAEQHLEITAGSPDAELLPDGSVLQSKDVLRFAQMAEVFGEMNDRIRLMIDRLSDTFNDDNRTHFNSMLSRMDTLVQQGRGPFLSAVNNMNELSEQLTGISRNLKSLTDRTGENMEPILANLQTTTEKANQLIKDMNSTVLNFGTLMSTNQHSVNEIVSSLHITSQNLEELSRLIKERPWLLVRKSAPPERNDQ